MHESAEAKETNQTHYAQAAVESLLALDDQAFGEQMPDFIADRLQQLEQETPTPDGPLQRHQPHYQGFVPATTEVRPVPYGFGFKVDDPEMYDYALLAMRATFEHAGDTYEGTREQYVGMALRAVQRAQEVYFGSVKPREDSLAERDFLTVIADKATSIKDLKNAAFCTERAAVANNMLQLLGAHTRVVFGKLTVEGKASSHTFLEVEDGKGGSMVYDPMNPWLTYNESRQLSASEPATYQLPEVNGEPKVDTAIKTRVEVHGRVHEAVQPCTYDLAVAPLTPEVERRYQQQRAFLDDLQNP